LINLLSGSDLKQISPYLIISALSMLIFFPFLEAVHLFDWDEINFAESAREMLITGNFSQVQINFRPFWEKPPLFIWMQALSMKIFGINEFAARFPNALCGVLTLLIIFHLGKKHFGSRMGWLWVACYIGSFTPHLYFKSGIIDPWFNLFIFLGIAAVADAAMKDKKARKLPYALAGIFIGLALLTKGPVAILIMLLCTVCFFIYKGGRFFFDVRDLLLFTLTCAAVSFVWYGTEIIRNGFWFLTEFIAYQKELASESVATHGQPWYYHPVVLLLGCFPASVIAIRAFGEKLTANDEQVNFRQWMSILFWVVLVLFSLVKTKIVHYSSLCYLPLTFLAALSIENTLNLKIQPRALISWLVLITGSLMGLIFTAVPLAALIPAIKNRLAASLNDPFAVANLGREVSWNGTEALPGLLLLAGTGYAFYAFRKKKLLHAYIGILGSGLLSLQLLMLLVVPKIEQHSQGAAIGFFKALRHKDVYVETLGYKSYAQYFYPQTGNRADSESFLKYAEQHRNAHPEIPERDRPALLFRNWLLEGDIDKQAYFSCKNIHAEEFRKIPGLKEIGQDGGFVFFMREKTAPQPPIVSSPAPEIFPGEDL
jgi:4-amino-4-deoxy-L-arabinose transferase-like glycosyltransferase